MTKISLKNKVKQIITILSEKYPEPKCALDHMTPWQLLVATILSAQCTDKRVNMITPALFKKFPTIESFAKADIKILEQYIHSAGFYHNKAMILKMKRLCLEIWQTCQEQKIQQRYCLLSFAMEVSKALNRSHHLLEDR